MQPGKSFTGRTRQRRSTWSVRAADRVARALIAGGGIGTIIAVSMVCVFLISVVMPLFLPPSIRLEASLNTALDGRPLHLAVSDYLVGAWSLQKNGTIDVFRLLSDPAPDLGGQRLETRPILSAGEAAVTAVAVDRDLVALGLADGSLRLANVRFAVETSRDGKALENASKAPRSPGQIPFIDERLPNGSHRMHSLDVRLEPQALELGDDPIVALDMSVRPSGPVFCTLSKTGVVRLHVARRTRNMETDQEELRVQSVALSEPVAGGALPMAVLLSGMGDSVFVVWHDGTLVRHDVRKPSKPAVAETVDLVAEPGETVTALDFMIGKSTLVVGDSTGRIRGWFTTHREQSDGTTRLRLAAAHTIAGRGSAVTALASSYRTRMVAAGFADGTVRLIYLTSDRLLVESQVAEQAPVMSLAMAPRDNGLVALSKEGLSHWELDIPHPEVSFRSLFLPAWYEGSDAPAHVWQSSSGTDDFEPKLGLWPLVFGTIKATFYSLLLAVPLALLAAIYTSEFLHRGTRARIKPAIEMMASLPSVVLGFVAAILLAPLVEEIVPAILAALVTIPLTLLTGAFLWQMLPSAMRVILQGYRLVVILAVLPLGILAAWRLGPVLERFMFAGELRAWLEGGVGNGSAGWLFMILPLASLLAAWLLAARINPWLRQVAAGWHPTQAAALDFAKFIVAVVTVLAGSYVVAWLLAAIGFDPRGSYMGKYEQRNALVVGFIMGFAIIPIIYTIAEDALSSIPDHLRSASLGSGATRWQTATRIVVPTAMSGLFSAVMIGLGRAVGETMIVLMAAGNTPVLDWNVFNGFRTLSANIAVELPEAVRNSSHYRTLFLAALVLFALTFALNTAAEAVRQRFRKRAVQL